MTDARSGTGFPNWDESERSHLLLGRRLSFSECLDWIEEAAEIARRLQKTPDDKTSSPPAAGETPSPLPDIDK